MDIYDVIRNRRSVRKYKSTPVAQDKIDRILEAVRLAPSAANLQPWHFILIRDEKMKRSLKDAYGRDWFIAAPVIVCACAEPGKGWVRRDGKNYADVDVTIAFEHLVLAAAAEGLGTCWIGAFDPVKLKKILGLPDGIEPLAMTPLGTPDDTPRPTGRKSLSEILRFERW